MLRRSQKDASRERILNAAARLMREGGIDGFGVAEAMNEAGLTHGGFYAHFASKDELVAQALTRAAESSRGQYFAGLRGKRGVQWLTAAARRYLSRAHRDDPGNGCPYATLATDAGRRSARVRGAFDRQLRESAKTFEEHLREAGCGQPEDRALALLALCAGGLAFSRAVEDVTLSDRILEACNSLVRDGLPRKGE
jgi:TetR/AcrR family transcriptional repressor of nem operon